MTAPIGSTTFGSGWARNDDASRLGPRPGGARQPVPRVVSLERSERAPAGAPFGRHPVTGEPYSNVKKTTAAWLNVIPGMGRAYRGHVGMAVAQWLAVWLTGTLGWLWSVGDGMVTLLGHPRDRYGRPLR